MSEPSTAVGAVVEEFFRYSIRLDWCDTFGQLKSGGRGNRTPTDFRPCPLAIYKIDCSTKNGAPAIYLAEHLPSELL